jgi:hypothetical protein
VNTKFRPKMTAINAAKDGEQYVFTYKPLKEKKGTLVLAG